MNDHKMSDELTEDEHAIYDRQLRTWGLEAQKRMKISSVLLVGIRGIAAEIAKNLVLTGIGELTILDDQLLSALDLASNFFTSEQFLNKNRAESCRERIQLLNPNVKIHVDTEDIMKKNQQFFKQFNAIILTNSDVSEAIHINNILRTHSNNSTNNRPVALFQCETHGFYNYAIEDLISHTALLTKKVETQNEITKQTEEIEETFSKTFDYPSISKIIESSNNTNTILKEFRKPSEKQLGKQWILFQILFQYRIKFELTHNHNKNQLDLQQLIVFASQYLKSHNLAADFITGDMLEQFVRCIGIEVSPITSVFGGMIAQEVLKVLSGKDEPLKNVLLYNSTLGNAMVYEFGQK